MRGDLGLIEVFDNVAKSGMTRTNNHGFHVWNVEAKGSEGVCAVRVASDFGGTVHTFADGCGARPRTRPQIDIWRPVR